MNLPSDLELPLRAGLDVLVPPELLASLRSAYPRSRFAALDPACLAGLTQVDLVALVGPLSPPGDEVRLLRAIHLSLRPGGRLLWCHAQADPAHLADAGFGAAHRLDDATWIAQRSVR